MTPITPEHTCKAIPLCACCAPIPIPGFPFFIPPHATMLDAALIYAASGWPVFPCQPIDKSPYTTHGFKEATTDPKQIRRWWTVWPKAMIGVPMGSRSGVSAVDLDRKEADKDGVATWAKLTTEHGEEPQTLSSTTPSTGQHKIFHHVEGMRSLALNTLAPGIEIKGEGGYIIVPPSFCTDPKFNGGTGAAYRWNEPLLAPTEMPDWLAVEILATNYPANEPPPNEPPADVPVERIKVALDVINPDIDRKTWIAIGCALYKQLGNNGFVLWDSWSRKGHKYNGREMSAQWKSIVKENGYAYSIGTLFYHANKTKPDWDQPTAPPVKEPATPHIEEPNRPGTPADGGQHAQDEEWPELDKAAYHGFAGEVVRTIEPHTEADPVALALQLLLCFGNIIDRTRYIRIESTRHHANLFGTLVGRSAKARKGTSLERIRSVVKYADPIWEQERVQGGLSSGEGLIHVVRDPIMKWDKKEQQYVEVDHGVDDKRLLVEEPEFAGVLAVMTRGGNTISHLIRKAWDGGRLQTMTRKEPLTATGAHVSIIGHVTEDELRANLTRTDMASGFANRFLFALVKRSKLLSLGGKLSDSDTQKLGEQFKLIVEAVKGDPLNGVVPPPEVTLTEGATEMWDPIYREMANERPGLLGAITARGETQTLRVAMIYALLDNRDQIDLPHLKAALAVWRYCEASAAHIFGATLGDEVADAILRALKIAGRVGLSRTDIRDRFGRNQLAARTDAALALLAEKGLARFEIHHGGRGRPAEIWFVK
jgi:Bifunctional DNA primase/polymerase, N-terminal/Protein of unknown function (DUF3987)/Primase C terminal 2 (PriCT-2)